LLYRLELLDDERSLKDAQQADDDDDNNEYGTIRRRDRTTLMWNRSDPIAERGVMRRYQVGNTITTIIFLFRFIVFTPRM
jgi:hypothetical protein